MEWSNLIFCVSVTGHACRPARLLACLPGGAEGPAEMRNISDG